MAHDHDHLHVNAHDIDSDDFEYEDIDIKEALGLPDALPPIRLLPLPELAAEARKVPLTGQLAALARWVGKDGREVDEDGDLTETDQAAAIAAVGVTEAEFDFLWEYALGVEWLLFDPEDEDRVLPGETADDWASGDDESVFAVWSSTLAAVLGETLELYGPEPDFDDEDDEDDEDTDDFNFSGQGMAIAILLFLARREGLAGAEFAEVLWENAAGGVVDEADSETREELAEARERWEEEYGDPARLLLDKLHTLLAITETDDVVRLTPLALAALHEQLVEAGVEIPLLPQTAAELSGAELLAMAEGISDTEFEAEAGAWSAARGADAAARELLELAAEGDPGERLLAVAAITTIGADAESALRDSLGVQQVRGYAKVTLLSLAGIDNLTGSGGDVPAELELGPDDLAWLATDLLTLACDDEYPDPDDLAVSFREAVPMGQETLLFDAMARSAHPDAYEVLLHLGKYHPDKQVAKAARTAAHKAASRQR
jgi:hypothetical protein